jgi:hypothetical protein
MSNAIFDPDFDNNRVRLSNCALPSAYDKRMRISRVLELSAFVGLAITLPVLAQEKKIKRAELPASVEKTVVAQSQGATIRGFSEEKESGQTFYEVEMMVDGHSKDVLMSTDGAVVEVEEQVRLDSLTPAVQEGLQAKAD